MKENLEPAEEPKTNPEEATPVVESTPAAAEKEEPTEPVAETEEVKEAASVEVIEEAPAKKAEAPAAPVAEEEFDWDAYEKGDALSATVREKLKNIYDNTLNAIKDKEVVEGTVISINKREVVVNVGYKSDGIVPMSEFRYNPDLKVGDKVEVYIESQEDKKGQLILSHKQARATRSWDRVNEALESQEIVKGFVKCRTKGGMIVDVFGIEAFLPGSQIDVKPIRDYDVFVNKTMEFKVIKINHEFKNVVVSHKALIEAELENQKKEIISKLQKGQILEGTVKNITSYGVFIDLGGVDGLIHITDLSWGRVSHPEEIVSLDQKINVVILDFDDEKKRIALGLKQLSAHPWDALDPDLKVGDKVKGKVVVMADYGAFVEIAPGVEGLIHVSEMSWSQHLRSAQDFLKVGDEVETIILTLDREERKMSLGIKQLKTDPWDNIDEKYAIGTKHSAKVRNFTNFGVFVEIEEGVDGLIHISDLSWTKKVKHPSEFTQIGSEIEVQVLEIDKANRRLSLGHKQIEENPWDVLETMFTVDSIHEGVIVEMMDKGAVISLPYGVEGFATPKHLVKEDGSQAQIDEKLAFKVIEFNKDAKRIILSHSRIHEDAKRAEKAPAEASSGEAPKKSTRKSKKEENAPVQNIEKTTLGDIQSLADLKDQLVNAAAEKMEKAEKAKKAAKAKAETEKKTAEETTEEAPKKSTKKAKKEDEAAAEEPAEA
ncbi:MAG: 30S ribosomal protein S1 [Paludibacter sp.]|nr:30S ribosomal protein S1 [Paludibacter sp.]MDD4198656.1 30S ribosomal protein S1 [Paludibacter sp.]MDD4428354.1 30S ribosomal protein S1 [Paludibacter sp.]